jgi:SAM-dependent methyltransferase
MVIRNSYEDARRAEAYARLEFPGTYYLAYRDLPEIISDHVTGRKALDFGCGAGRSTRFLRALGFDAAGADISPDMIARARSIDPGGDYRLIREEELVELSGAPFDLVLAAFTFDNIPTLERKVSILRSLRRLLSESGTLVNLVSTPDIYLHEWASFSTRDYPENRDARSGDRVRIVITDIEDPRPVEDIVWSDADYREVYRLSGLECAATHHPLGRSDEPYGWINETRIAPWAIYTLKGGGPTRPPGG